MFFTYTAYTYDIVFLIFVGLSFYIFWEVAILPSQVISYTQKNTHRTCPSRVPVVVGENWAYTGDIMKIFHMI